VDGVWCAFSLIPEWCALVQSAFFGETLTQAVRIACFFPHPVLLFHLSPTPIETGNREEACDVTILNPIVVVLLVTQDVLSNLEPLVTSLPHQIKQRLVNVLQAETDKVDGWGVPIEGEAGIQTIIDSSLAQPVNILLRTLIPLAGENVLYWRCSCSNVGGAKPDLILVWRFHDEGMGVIREVVLAVMEIKTTNVMSATSANRISSAINTAGSVKYSDSTVVSNSTPLNNDERNIIEQVSSSPLPSPFP